MCWIKPNAVFPTNEYSVDGEELFVYDGSLIADKEEYRKWGWLRFPTGSTVAGKRMALKAGSTGAQVYRKTGHLAEKAMSMEKIKITEE
jgi:hypothetical protein